MSIGWGASIGCGLNGLACGLGQPEEGSKGLEREAKGAEGTCLRI